MFADQYLVNGNKLDGVRTLRVPFFGDPRIALKLNHLSNSKTDNRLYGTGRRLNRACRLSSKRMEIVVVDGRQLMARSTSAFDDRWFVLLQAFSFHKSIFVDRPDEA